MKLICWSGGYDSTLLVLRCVQQNIKFKTIYFNLPNNKVKAKAELECRRKIKHEIRRYYNMDFDDEVVEIPEIKYKPSTWLLTHPFLWNYGLIQFSPILEDYESILFGYYKTSEPWHIQHEIYDNFVSGMKITRCRREEVPKFEYPLEWHNKDQILNEYLSTEAGKSIRKLAWTCEGAYETSEGIKACGECLPCRKIKQYDIERITLVKDYDDRKADSLEVKECGSTQIQLEIWKNDIITCEPLYPAEYIKDKI